jgi:hypothetical protein
MMHSQYNIKFINAQQTNKHTNTSKENCINAAQQYGITNDADRKQSTPKKKRILSE